MDYRWSAKHKWNQQHKPVSVSQSWKPYYFCWAESSYSMANDYVKIKQYLKKKEFRIISIQMTPKALCNITMGIAVLESVICDFSSEKGKRSIQFMPRQKVSDLQISKRTKQLQQRTNDWSRLMRRMWILNRYFNVGKPMWRHKNRSVVEYLQQ